MERRIRQASQRAEPTGMPDTKMDQKTFQQFCEFVYQQSGITLKPGKEALVSARIGKRMRALRIDDAKAYLEYVKKEKSGTELIHMIDAISTNLTSFFREAVHFDFLRDILSEWHAAGQRRYRIWCAAASTGEEPYSIAMTLMDTIGTKGIDARILATDISTRVLKKCQEATYPEDRLTKVPKTLRTRFFDTEATPDGRWYAAKPALRDLLVFRRLNLSTPPFPLRGPIDVVFCRNVMIYFDNHIRKNLVDEIYRIVRPGGYLLVGHSESLTGIQHSFKTVKPATYLRP